MDQTEQTCMVAVQGRKAIEICRDLTDVDPATLSYYLSISSSEGASTAYDRLTVTVNGTSVQSFSNVNKGTGYVQRSVSLSAYAGQTVTLKWTGTEDSSLQTSFFVDDTAVTLA